MLPTGWEQATLAGLIGVEGVFTDGDWIESKDQDPNGDVRLVQLADMGVGMFLDKSRRFLTRQRADELKCTYLQEGDVLVARMPEPLGRACLYPGREARAVTAVDVTIVRPGREEVCAPLLVAFINSPQFRRRVAALQSGSTRKRISRKNLASIDLPVPPAAEQRRIVARIEELFSDIDAGVASLDRVRLALKRYRTSVLRAAITGQLTEQWREEHPDVEPASNLVQRMRDDRRGWWEADHLRKYEARGKKPPKGWRDKYPLPIEPSGGETASLPRGWAWATADQVTLFVRYGSSAKASSDENGVPVLRMGNIQEGELRLGDLKYLPADHREFPDLLLEPGDLLFNRTNSAELVGKSAVYAGKPSPCSFASYLIVARPIPGCSADYVSNYLNSVLGRLWVAQVVSQQVGQANVSGSKLRALTFPLPPQEEQEMIVALVDEALSGAKVCEKEINQARRQAAQLRSVILRHAFEGRLVCQEPSEESASFLLSQMGAPFLPR